MFSFSIWSEKYKTYRTAILLCGFSLLRYLGSFDGGIFYIDNTCYSPHAHNCRDNINYVVMQKLRIVKDFFQE